MTIYSKQDEDEGLSIVGELHRKTIEALESAMRERARGAISEEMYQAKLYAIDDVTRGLVNSEINLAIDQDVQDLSRLTETQVMINIDREELVFLVRELGAQEFVICQVPAASIIRKKYRLEESDDPVEGAYKKFNQVIDKLKERDFERFEGIL